MAIHLSLIPDIVRHSSVIPARFWTACVERNMSAEHHPNENHLLAVLPEAEWARLSPHLMLVDMPLGQVAVRDGGRRIG
jgi:hypothetical protein